MITVDGYELIVGSSLDPQFGPVLLFGSGGKLVEVYRDRALALPPLNTTLARRLMEQTKMFTALRGVRGAAPVDLEALERLLVRFSELVVQQPRIKEIDINPLLASSDRIIALDARVVLHPSDVRDADLPRSAIRPYPLQYQSAWTWLQPSRGTGHRTLPRCATSCDGRRSRWSFPGSTTFAGASRWRRPRRRAPSSVRNTFEPSARPHHRSIFVPQAAWATVASVSGRTNSCSGRRTVSTGHDADRTTRSATLPMTRCASAPRPRVPMTMMPMSWCLV